MSRLQSSDLAIRPVQHDAIGKALDPAAQELFQLAARQTCELRMAR